MNMLQKVVDNVAGWQSMQTMSKRSRAHRCLECIRACCLKEGLRLPPPTSENTALADFRLLAQNPSEYGWKQVRSPLSGLVLVYFKDCGRLPDGRTAGHIAVLDTEKRIHFSNIDYPFTKWWADRIVGAFVPA